MKNNKIDKSTGGGESQLPAVVQEGRVLTAREFRGLAQVPSEAKKAIAIKEQPDYIKELFSGQCRGARTRGYRVQTSLP